MACILHLSPKKGFLAACVSPRTLVGARSIWHEGVSAVDPDNNLMKTLWQCLKDNNAFVYSQPLKVID
jgi:hypothetical protein